MDYEQEYIEPESAFSFKDGKAEVKILFSAESMEKAATDLVQQHIENNFMPIVRRKLDEYLKLQGYGNFGELMTKTIAEEFLKRYPDVVENKANEISEYIKNQKPENFKDYRWGGESISQAARNKVTDYIEKELKKEVEVTKEYLEQFSRNYFANNLFRAMGMLDSMIPQVTPNK